MIKLTQRKTIAFLVLTLVFTASFAVSASAQFTRIMIPLPTYSEANPLPGSGGSLWVSELYGYNASTHAIQFDASCNPTIGCPSFPAHSSFKITYLDKPTIFNLYPEDASQLALSLNVRDLSRLSTNWGTQIPAVRESDVYSTVTNLPGIPVDDRYRLTLRIYDFDGNNGNHVRVRFYNDNNVMLAEDTVPLTGPHVKLPNEPGYIEIFDLTTRYEALRGQSRVRIEITPLDEGLRFWAFVSISNNDTQAITVVIPS